MRNGSILGLRVGARVVYVLIALFLYFPQMALSSQVRFDCKHQTTGTTISESGLVSFSDIPEGKRNLLANEAEITYQQFIDTGCYEDLLGSFLLYQRHYRMMEEKVLPRYLVSEHVSSEYQRWIPRLSELGKSRQYWPTQVAPSLDNISSRMQLFQDKLQLESNRVDKLLVLRKKIMLTSIIGVASGVLTLIWGGVVLHYDGEPYPEGICDGERGRCLYTTKKLAIPLFVIGGVFTLGGSTGLGVSLYQSTHQFSPVLE